MLETKTTMGQGRGQAPSAASGVRAARPHYVAVGNEERVFKAAYRQGMSILIKGPPGCGKTRFVEAMAHALGRALTRALSGVTTRVA